MRWFSWSRLVVALVFALAVSVVAPTAHAVTSGGAPNPLQALIDAASPGATIAVPPGTYVGGIDFHGKDIVLRATGGASVTTLDADGGVGVLMGPGGTLDGFTITDAYASFGAGIAVSGVGSLITNNVFDSNSQGSGGFGAAIGGNNASPTITGNRFLRNDCDSQWLSGVIGFVNGSSPVISNNEFLDNPCRAVNLTLPVGTSPLVVNNTFVGNSVGVRIDGRVPSEETVVRNNVLVGNGVGLEIDFGSGPTWDHNLVWQNTADYQGLDDPTGTEGNLRADPKFRDPAGDDFHLDADSPAIDTGSEVGAPATDLDGAVRPFDGNVDGVTASDIGAYERGRPDQRFHPVTPTRVVDTRLGQGGARLAEGGSLDVQIAGAAGVPATGVSAVAVNLTVVEPSDMTFVTAWPTGLPRPTTSNVNAAAGAIIANSAQIGLGTGGRITLFNAAGSADVLVDVVGWFDTSGDGLGSRFVAIQPNRIVDTRLDQGASTLGSGSTATVRVAGTAGVPSTGVTAVAINLTAVDQSALTYLTAWSSGDPRPVTSTVNAAPGWPVPNLAVVEVSAGGDIDLFNAAGSTDAVVDVLGWWSDDPLLTDGVFIPVTPTRVLDTRLGLGAPQQRVGPGASVEVGFVGDAGTTDVPVRAVAVNITASVPTSESLVTAHPTGAALPATSNLNLVPYRNVAGFAIVKVGANGKITLHNSAGDVDLVVDILGWYTGP